MSYLRRGILYSPSQSFPIFSKSTVQIPPSNHRMYPFGLLLGFSPLLALATPLLNHAPSHNALNASYICLPPVYLPSLHPSYTACAHAIRLLPSDHIFRTFHTTGPRDPSTLPASRVYRFNAHTEDSCLVKVELKRGIRTETCTWSAIGVAARRLAEECRERAEGRDITGGSTQAGTEEAIVVSLEKGRGRTS